MEIDKIIKEKVNHSQKLKAILSEMLNYNSNSRPTCKELLKKYFNKNFDKDLDPAYVL